MPNTSGTNTWLLRCEVCDCITEGQDICPSCAQTHHRCLNCYNWIPNSDSLCIDCATEEEEREEELEDDISDVLLSHNYKPTPCFLPRVSSSWLYLGVELEVDEFPRGYYREAASTLNGLNDRRFYLKEDGSLNDGIEIVSHPATLGYHLAEFPWQQITLICKEHGGKSHDSSHAGLHVHINSSFFNRGAKPDLAYARAVLRLIHIFNKEWIWLADFSRRKGNFNYCRPHRKSLAVVSGKDLLRMKSNGDCDKYTCLNFSPEETIEFRIFRGTLHLPTFFACLELVDFLAGYVRRTPMKTLKSLPPGKLWQEIPPTYYNLTAYIKECFKEEK